MTYLLVADTIPVTKSGAIRQLACAWFQAYTTEMQRTDKHIDFDAKKRQTLSRTMGPREALTSRDVGEKH